VGQFAPPPAARIRGGTVAGSTLRVRGDLGQERVIDDRGSSAERRATAP
jgi:hypothetical protein